MASSALSATSSGAEQKILNLFARKPKTRLTPAEILRRGGFAPHDLDLVVESLKSLAREGRIVRLKKNHYALPDSRHLLTGRVHAHPDGYGFLIPDEKGV